GGQQVVVEIGKGQVAAGLLHVVEGHLTDVGEVRRADGPGELRAGGAVAGLRVGSITAQGRAEDLDAVRVGDRGADQPVHDALVPDQVHAVIADGVDIIEDVGDGCAGVPAVSGDELVRGKAPLGPGELVDIGTGPQHGR